MNFTKMVESELLVLNEAKGKKKTGKKTGIKTSLEKDDIFYKELIAISTANNMTLTEAQLQSLLQTGSSLGRGGQKYASKPELLRERQNFPFLDLGYSLWTLAERNGNTNISALLNVASEGSDILNFVNNTSKGSKGAKFKAFGLAELNKELKWQMLKTVKFTDYDEADFKSPRLRQLFNQTGSGIAINEYSNKTILQTLLEITKIKSKTQKFNYNEKSVLDIIYYPLDYARGKKSMDVSLSRGLLTCVESIISWYIDNIEKNKLIDKNVGEDATVVGSELARKKDFQLQKGYIQLLNGVTNIELKSVAIPDVTKTGETPDANYDKRKLNSIEKVEDCKSIAPEIYNAISIYAQEIKEKSKDFAERFKTAGQAFGGIFTT